ncbi:MAG: hypothetical protein ACUZ8E_01955, partial [Candidatus Anammoxibacter sp.]
NLGGAPRNDDSTEQSIQRAFVDDMGQITKMAKDIINIDFAEYSEVFGQGAIAGAEMYIDAITLGGSSKAKTAAKAAKNLLTKKVLKISTKLPSGKLKNGLKSMVKHLKKRKADYLNKLRKIKNNPRFKILEVLTDSKTQRVIEMLANDSPKLTNEEILGLTKDLGIEMFAEGDILSKKDEIITAILSEIIISGYGELLDQSSTNTIVDEMIKAVPVLGPIAELNEKLNKTFEVMDAENEQAVERAVAEYNKLRKDRMVDLTRHRIAKIRKESASK